MIEHFPMILSSGENSAVTTTTNNCRGQLTSSPQWVKIADLLREISRFLASKGHERTQTWHRVSEIITLLRLGNSEFRICLKKSISGRGSESSLNVCLQTNVMAGGAGGGHDPM